MRETHFAEDERAQGRRPQAQVLVGGKPGRRPHFAWC
jgi:hypothetical protein